MFASVYNEYLIKRVAGAEVDIMVQNVFMYLNSIICNVIVLVMKGDLVIAFSHEALASIVQVSVTLCSRPTVHTPATRFFFPTRRSCC